VAGDRGELVAGERSRSVRAAAANVERWYAVVDEVTGETGLVTSEMVPASWIP